MADVVLMQFTHRFNEKRKYRKYYQDTKLVDEIFSFFATHDEKTYTLVELSENTNVATTVLSKWRLAYKKDASYRPGGKFGVHRRRFTQIQEKAIAEMLRIQYVIPGIIVRRKHLRHLFFDLWKIRILFL